MVHEYLINEKEVEIMAENLVNAFVTLVIENSDYEELDRIYLTNKVFALVGEGVADVETESSELIDLKDQLLQAGVKAGSVGELNEEQDIIGAQLMDLITPSPSAVNRNFWDTYKSNPEQAIADFYVQSKRNDYVKVKAIAQNIAYKAPTKYGDLEITINLSKPEKDPKAIAAAKNAVASDYPKCQLCMENEGYLGRINHPARSNHRVIRFQMEGNDWGFQYSPYAYFNEHSIFFYGKHEPMHISPLTFGRLLSIVEAFPGYFAGSNADLPIVGGSILTHDHFQGGHYTFAMAKSDSIKTFKVKDYEDVDCSILHWPLSVIRLKSKDSNRLVELGSHILNKWRNYTDEDAFIYANTDGEPHNTITPIARFRDGMYELDLALRNNITTKEHPLGVYHPHEKLHHIKKENIGLIEVMGLAVLPSRLKGEIQTLADYIVNKKDIRSNESISKHADWVDEFLPKYNDITSENVMNILESEIGKVFVKVLEDAGVYKCTPEGLEAFTRFIDTL